MKVVALLVFFSVFISVASLAQIDTLSHDDNIETTAPEFPGGSIALQEYISKNLIYPKKAKQKRVQGKVYVQFLVKEDGNITSIKISKGLSKECDEEVIRLIKDSPRWIPATEDRVPIENWMILPIEFTLRNED
ncbi:MAG: energy transducer TonB [Azospira oryzae]|jgi:TonB family protein|nr:MAG: energy transducer TonB [Azospira oryzae]